MYLYIPYAFYMYLLCLVLKVFKEASEGELVACVQISLVLIKLV